MPLHCPRCQAAHAEENQTCTNCGQSLPAAPAAPFADSFPATPARQAFWRLPALIVAGLLLALTASALLIPRHRTARPVAPAQASMPAKVPPVPVFPPAPATAPPAAPIIPVVSAPPSAPAPLGGVTKTAGAELPLAITLTSASAGRHVNVGDAVTFTAFTALARNRSVTLTLFYQRGRGRKTMLSFAQGSLCSTTWTPSVPGRYEFMATALGDGRQAAASRGVQITVDGPAPQTFARSEAVQAPRPQPARLPPLRTAMRRATPLRTTPLRTAPLRTAPLRTAPLRTMPLRTAPPSAVLPRATAPRPAPALTYHVAAAFFSFPRSAAVLADALNRRGFPAVPERMADAHGKTVYVVVTGSYGRPDEARKAALALQRSGYPAYFFGGR